jgi:hypothetical protein
LSAATPESSGAAGRPGRFRVLGVLLIGITVLTIVIVGMSTREPSNEFRGVEGSNDAQRIFGGVFQLGDRLGAGNSPVQVQVFTDVQAAGFSDWFVEVIPTLTDGPVRAGDVQLLLRNRSLTRNPTELSFFGIEAAAEQDYAWNYAYLVVRNLDLAREVGLDAEFLEDIAAAIQGVDLAVWKSDYERGLEPDSEVMMRLEEQDKLAIDLGLRAQPALVVTGPGGTEVLQDTPGLDEIRAAIERVG